MSAPATGAQTPASEPLPAFDTGAEFTDNEVYARQERRKRSRRTEATETGEGRWEEDAYADEVARRLLDTLERANDHPQTGLTDEDQSTERESSSESEGG